MAKLDKSQGFTFVFADLHKLHQSVNKSKLSSPLIVERDHANIQPMGVIEAEEKARRLALKQTVSEPLEKLKENLNSLAKAHAKLRFLLQEIDATTKRSSGKN